MKFTDDAPVRLQDVRVVVKRQGPIHVSNHSAHGFNVRHFYYDWETETFKAGRSGIAIEPSDAGILIQSLVDFVNENDILPGQELTLTITEK